MIKKSTMTFILVAVVGSSLVAGIVGGPKSASAASNMVPDYEVKGTGTEYIVEASFKTTSQTTASTKHDELITYLQGKGWFLAQDSLKTQLIMDRY